MDKNSNNLTALRGANRFYSLDKLKAICAFLIVCIHAPFPGTFGNYFTSLTRIAVPIFFMISGYFFSAVKAKSQIKKVLQLVVVSNSIYFIFRIANAVLRHNLIDYIYSVFTIKRLVLFFIFNESPFAVHLWYLGAIFYVYILFYMADKNGWLNRIVMLFPILLVVDIVFGKYSLLVFQCEFPVSMLRNWLFVGVPYFSIGLLIQKNSRILSDNANKHILELSIVAFSFTTILERFFLISNQINTIRDQYISTTFLAVSVFLFFLYFVDNQQNMLAQIGCNESTGVYIIHFVFIKLLGGVVNYFPQFDFIYNLVRPVIIFILSVLVIKFVKNIYCKEHC